MRMRMKLIPVILPIWTTESFGTLFYHLRIARSMSKVVNRESASLSSLLMAAHADYPKFGKRLSSCRNVLKRRSTIGWVDVEGEQLRSRKGGCMWRRM